MIYLLHGPDTYRSRTKLREIIVAFQAKAGGAFNVTRLDAEEEFEAVQAIGRAAPLFAQKELYVIERISGAAKEDQAYVREWLERWADDRDLTVVFWEAEREAKDAMLAAVKKHAAKSQEFKALPGAAVRRWLAAEAERRGIRLGRENAERLHARFGPDLWALSHELEKIASGWSEHYAIDAEENVWSFTDEFFRRRRASALSLGRLLAAGYEPIYVLGALAGALRTLALVQDGLERGTLKRLTAKLHPYVIKKNAELARRLRRSDISDYFSALLLADLELKTGQLPPPLPLIKLALQ